MKMSGTAEKPSNEQKYPSTEVRRDEHNYQWSLRMLLVLMLDLCVPAVSLYTERETQASPLSACRLYISFHSFLGTIQGVASGLWLVYDLIVPLLVWTAVSWNSR